MWTALVFCALLAPPVDAPIVPASKRLEEPGRFLSGKSYEDTLKYYKRFFRGTGGVRWRSVVNMPGVRAKHVQSLSRKTDWEGINIYEHRGQVKLYVIPREDEPKVKGRRSAKRRR